MSASPEDFLDRAQGTGITEAVRIGIVGWILAVSASVIAGFQTLLEFMFLPFELLIDVAVGSIDAFVLQPFGITEVGAAITSGELDIFGIFALPFSVIIALGTLFIVIMYLQFQTTANIFPGLLGIDNRLADLFFTTSEEEAEGED